MIYIVHGEDTPKSRALIVNHQKKLNNVSRINLDLKNISPEQLYEKCVSNSLFGEAPLVVLDITDNKKTDISDYIEKLTKIPDETTLIIYCAKLLGKTNPFIKNADAIKAKVIENNTFSDANVFKFTDALFEKNRIQAYKELNKLTLKGFDPFYIFSMTMFGLRSIAKSVWKAPSVLKQKPFQISKNQGLARRFSSENLDNFFEYFYDLEKKTKTGVITPELMLTLSVEKVLNSK